MAHTTCGSEKTDGGFFFCESSLLKKTTQLSNPTKGLGMLSFGPDSFIEKRNHLYWQSDEDMRGAYTRSTRCHTPNAEQALDDINIYAVGWHSAGGVRRAARERQSSPAMVGNYFITRMRLYKKTPTVR
jgi:hypothetical protein